MSSLLCWQLVCHFFHHAYEIAHCGVLSRSHYTAMKNPIAWIRARVYVESVNSLIANADAICSWTLIQEIWIDGVARSECLDSKTVAACIAAPKALKRLHLPMNYRLLKDIEPIMSSIELQESLVSLSLFQIESSSVLECLPDLPRLACLQLLGGTVALESFSLKIHTKFPLLRKFISSIIDLKVSHLSHALDLFVTNSPESLRDVSEIDLIELVLDTEYPFSFFHIAKSELIRFQKLQKLSIVLCMDSLYGDEILGLIQDLFEIVHRLSNLSSLCMVGNIHWQRLAPFLNFTHLSRIRELSVRSLQGLSLARTKNCFLHVFPLHLLPNLEKIDFDYYCGAFGFILDGKSEALNLKQCYNLRNMIHHVIHQDNCDGDRSIEKLCLGIRAETSFVRGSLVDVDPFAQWRSKLNKDSRVAVLDQFCHWQDGKIINVTLSLIEVRYPHIVGGGYGLEWIPRNSSRLSPFNSHSQFDQRIFWERNGFSFV